MTARRPQEVLRIMEEHVPFNRYLGIVGESASLGRAVLSLPYARTTSAIRGAPPCMAGSSLP